MKQRISNKLSKPKKYFACKDCGKTLKNKINQDIVAFVYINITKILFQMKEN